VAAISGADVVEKRSALVQRMRTLFEKVMKWGEKLVYTGTKDDSLPPDVLSALDEYLAESNSKLLVILPLRDERESKSKRPPRSGLMLECFEPSLASEQLVARMDVVGRHATPALYNATEHRNIPLRWLWQPLAYLQQGLGGKARAITAAVVVALVLIATLLALPPSVVVLPGQMLKMDTKGQLLPEQRRWVFAPVDSQLHHFVFDLKPGAAVAPDQPLAFMYGSQLEGEWRKLESDIKSEQIKVAGLRADLNNQSNKTSADSNRLHIELKRSQAELQNKIKQLDALKDRTNSDDKHPGLFTLKAPRFSAQDDLPPDALWTVLNWDFKENLTNRLVKPSDPLLRVGNQEGRWEIELKIPQKHIGQVLQAFPSNDENAELDVDLLLLSAPTKTFKGKLARNKIAGEAVANHEDATDSEPTVLASVRIEGEGIDKDKQIPRDLLKTGMEVHAKVLCGRHPIGYSLFYGVWEFIYEKVLFFF
jgi:hypothetical protein